MFGRLFRRQKVSAGAVGQYAFHVHHEKLYEKLTEPLEGRLKYIESSKNQSEIPLRRKLMRVVKDQKGLEALVKDLAAGWERYEKALSDVLTAQRKKAPLGKAEEAVEAAYHDVSDENKAIYALHKKECEPDCPWDGASIFGKKVAV
jgi:hypothetical protein